MGDRYRLGGIANQELLARLTALVRRGNELTADLLAHLAEVVERRLHLELGYPSAFAYCVEGLGLSEPAAGRRIAAAHVCRRFPQAFAAVSCGDLHLSALCALSPYLSASNADVLFEAACRKSRRQIEEFLALRFRKPDVRQQIRRLADRITPLGGAPTLVAPVITAKSSHVPDSSLQIGADQNSVTIGSRQEATVEPVPNNEVTSVGAHPPKLAAVHPLESSAAREPLQAAVAASEPPTAAAPLRYGVHFTVDEETRAMFDEAAALMGHQLASADIAGLIKVALRTLIADRKKKHFALGHKPRATSSKRSSVTSRAGGRPGAVMQAQAPSPGDSGTQHANRSKPQPEQKPRSRHIPAAIAREVYERDGGLCTFVAEDGRRCAARRSLELDHVRPFAERGPSTSENLRLRCRSHNQHAAHLHFGTAHIRAAIEAARSR